MPLPGRWDTQEIKIWHWLAFVAGRTRNQFTIWDKVSIGFKKQHIYIIMQPLLKHIKERRLELALKQHDMLLRIGISRQQYQKLESKGNPRLDTLELIAKRLKSELLLIPQKN